MRRCGRRGSAIFIAVCLIAANMRTTITGVGPLLEQIADDLGTTTVALGALASIPLAAWALVSPLAHGLSQRFGMSRTLLWSLIALTVGTVWRSLPGPSANLWLGTAIIGASLAIANVLMPAVIKRDFRERVPATMGVYTALLAGVGAVASGIVVPVSQLGAPAAPLGWRGALATTGILLPIAVVSWVLAMRRLPRETPVRHVRGQARTGIWTDPVAWQVAGYMGLQSAAFYVQLTWLAPYATAHGRDPVAAGLDVMIYQVLGIVGSLALPAFLRSRARRWAPAAIPVFSIVAVVGMLAAPDLLTLWALPSGLSAGASLGMSLTLMAERARDNAASTALSGMSQSVGYLLAAAGPVAFGLLHALDGGWLLPFGLVLTIMLAQLVVGIAVGRDRYVLDRG
ncbi:MFS transporter [Microbacterium sp. SORGH_AS_0888]|uniref:MFS transporter n=1 Tax=Microbacterium sp. SORGH_AS_0888 TaxID=3041791 RepID=UPI0027858494|nr:MFS transporter [Microbacterium sp. SORGH_AS_0888]MDQ1129622.1 CP family cyanate transporter-like MFS transporter [Microbacterium sp. SORGH_AS_0888]